MKQDNNNSNNDDMERLSLGELKARLAGGPELAVVWGQIERATKKTGRNGKPYLEWTVRDAGDSAGIKVWDNHPAFAEAAALRGGTFLELAGGWAMSEYGLEPRDWTFRALSAEEQKEVLAGSPEMRETQKRDYAEIERLGRSLADPRLKALVMRFLEQFGARFKRTAGARDYHHARRGGLVEHTAQMMRAASALAAVYPVVNRDLLLAGALFHDCGKLWENCYAEGGFNMPYPLSGEMLGHITIGIELVNKLWRELMDSAEAKPWRDMEPAGEDVRLHLLHLVASHHGEYAFGSPVLPKTPEAMLLHYIDNIDAKMEMLRKAYDGTEIAPGIFDKVRPLPQRLVKPLAHVMPEKPPEDEEGLRVMEEEDALESLWIKD